MNLQMLSFSGDKILDRRIKEASNYRDSSHLYAATFGLAQLVFAELSPIDLDGHGKLTVIANTEQPLVGKPGYNRDAFSKVSYYNLNQETSKILYQFQKFGTEFQEYTVSLLLDILAEIDQANGGKNQLAQRRDGILNHLREADFYREILLEKFSKVSKNRKYQGLVYQCLSQRHGEAILVKLVNRSAGEAVASQWVTTVPSPLYNAQSIAKTCWEGNRFCVVFHKTPPQRMAYVELPEPS